VSVHRSECDGVHVKKNHNFLCNYAKNVLRDVKRDDVAVSLFGEDSDQIIVLGCMKQGLNHREPSFCNNSFRRGAIANLQIALLKW